MRDLELDSGSICHRGRLVGYVLGGLDGFLYALLAFVVIDYITGMCAVLDKLSSEVDFRGYSKGTDFCPRCCWAYCRPKCNWRWPC